MPFQEVYYARRSATGLTFFTEVPAQGPYTRPTVPVIFRKGVIWCQKHRAPLSVCGCLDAPNWPSPGQQNRGTADKRKEVAS